MIPTYFKTPELGGAFCYNLDFDGQFISAHAVPMAWKLNPASRGIPQVTVHCEGGRARIEGETHSADDRVRFLVVALVREDTTSVVPITVSWNLGRLLVHPHCAEVNRISSIKWQPSSEDPCNIVGVYGLPLHEFGQPSSLKSDEGPSESLLWLGFDRCKIADTFAYSILAEKNGKLAYTDPKITNKPTGIVIEPTWKPCGEQR